MKKVLLSLCLLTSSILYAQNTITVNPSITYQTMTGWQGVSEVGQTDHKDYYSNWKDEAIDLAVNEAGINRILIIAGCASENPVDYFTQFWNDQITRDEWKTIKKHSDIGYRIAKSTQELTPIAHSILHHHEWWDGNGYPKGLRGERIPLNSRIITIIDAYDAMTNDRPYRRALGKTRAIEELKNGTYGQFDPYLVEKFLRVI